MLCLFAILLVGPEDWLLVEVSASQKNVHAIKIEKIMLIL